MLLGLFVAGLASPLAKTVVWQVGEIAPDVGADLWIEPYRTVEGVLSRGPAIRAVHVALQRLAFGRSDEFAAASYRQFDPDNDLYDYLELAPLLAAGKDDAGLAERAGRLKDARPATLHLRRRYQQAEAVFLQAGTPPRVAARDAQCVPYVLRPLQEPYPRVLRSWSDAMLARGRSWREAGRPRDAVGAHSAVVRLLNDLVIDSPDPIVALTASEILPTAWGELKRDVETCRGRRAAADTGALVQAIRQQSERIASLRPRWHKIATEGMNVLPYTGLSYHVMLARPEHQRVMAALCWVAIAAVTWAVLLVLCIFLLLVAGSVSDRAGIEIRWRRPGVSGGLALLVVCGPAVLLMIWLRSAGIDYSWIVSLPSVWPVMLSPAVVLVFVGLAVRWCMIMAGPAGKSLATGGGLVVVVVFLLTLILLPLVLARHAWLPPMAIRVFRIGGLLIGIESVAVLVAWIGSALVRAGRGGFCLAAWSRAYLNVAATALLAMSLIATTALLINRQADLRHQQAFVRAAADPLTDRLGPGWLEQHLGGTASLLERIESLCDSGVAKPPPG